MRIAKRLADLARCPPTLEAPAHDVLHTGETDGQEDDEAQTTASEDAWIQEAARQKAEAEAQRLAAEEEVRLAAEAQRLAAEEESRLAAEAQRLAAAEREAALRASKEEARRQAAEEQAERFASQEPDIEQQSSLNEAGASNAQPSMA